MRKYRDEHDATRGNAQDRGYDGDWQKLRAYYLRRHPLCERCEGDGRTTVAVLVHHIVPISDGGARLDERNLMALCVACHDAKHAGKWAARPKG